MQLVLRHAKAADIEKIRQFHIEHGENALQARSHEEYLQSIDDRRFYVITNEEEIFTTGATFEISPGYFLLGAYADRLFINAGERGEQIIAPLSILEELYRKKEPVSSRVGLFLLVFNEETISEKTNLFYLPVKHNLSKLGFRERLPDAIMENHCKATCGDVPINFFDLSDEAIANHARRILELGMVRYASSSRRNLQYEITIDLSVAKEQEFIRAVAEAGSLTAIQAG